MAVANHPSSDPGPGAGTASAAPAASTPPNNGRQGAAPQADQAETRQARERNQRERRDDQHEHHDHAHPRRHRVRRFFARAALVVAVLLILALAATQLILWSSLPRKIVLAKLESQLGLRVGAKSLHAGWFGVDLRDVALSLPLAEQSVADVPALKVRHNFLPFLLLWGPDIKSVEMDRPVLHVWQSTDGRWNLAEVAELVGRAGGKKTGEATAKTATPASPPRLPRVLINDATVMVAAAHGKRETIEHVHIDGQPQDPLVWRYDVSIPDRLSLVGKVAPGGDWSHEVTVNIQPQMADLLRPWVAGVPAFSLDNARWTGRLQPGGGIGGRLDVGTLTVGEAKASGALDASAANGAVQIRPVNLALETGQKIAPRVVVLGGLLGFDGKTFTSKALQVKVAGGEARVDASFDTATTGGSVTAMWDGMSLTPVATGPRTSGTFEATLATRLAGRPEIRGKLDARGWLSASRSWQGVVQINGDGRSWSDIDWNITAPSAQLKGSTAVVLDGLSLALHQNGPQLDLTNIHLPMAMTVGATSGATSGAAGPSATGPVTAEPMAAANPVGPVGPVLVASTDPAAGVAAAAPNPGNAAATNSKDAPRAAGSGSDAGSSGSPSPSARLGGTGGMGAAPSPVAAPGGANRGANGTGGATGVSPAGPNAVAAAPVDHTARVINGSAGYNFSTQVWHLKVAGQGWPIPQLEDETLGFQIDADGNKQQVDLHDLSFFVAGMGVHGTGKYVYGVPKPLDVDVTVTHEDNTPATKTGKNSLVAERVEVVANQLGKKAVSPDEALIRGSIAGHAKVVGTLDPRQLDITGNLTGRDVRIRGRAVGDFNGKLSGGADEEAVNVQTDHFSLLGAQWHLEGQYRFGPEATSVKLDLNNFRLEDPLIQGLSGRNDLAGRFNGHWDLEVPGLEAREEHLHITGSLEGKDLLGPSFAADGFRAGMALENGNIVLDPIELTRQTAQSDVPTLAAFMSSRPSHAKTAPSDALADAASGSGAASPGNALLAAAPATGPTPTTGPAATTPTTPPAVAARPAQPAQPADGRPAPDSAEQSSSGGNAGPPVGHIRLAVATTLADLHRWTITHLDLDHWPVPIPQANSALVVSGGSDAIVIDLPNAASKGPARRLLQAHSRSIDIRSTILTALATPTGKGAIAPVGDASILLALDGRVTDVRDVQMHLLGAAVQAQAMIDLDHPLLASARFWVDNVDFKQISAVFPAVNRVQGTYDLSVAVTPARSPNALEPIQVDVALHSEGAHIGGVQLGDGRLRLYANLDPSWGLVRLVSEDEKQPALASDQNRPLRMDPRQPDQNTIELAGGALRVWSRFVRNESEAGEPGATSISSHLWLGFRSLDLNQLAHVADIQAPDMPGLLDGAMDLYGTTGIKEPTAQRAPVGTDPVAQAAATQPGGAAAAKFVPKDPFLVRLGRSLYGDGSVKLRNSNLANFGPINDLYNIMHIGNDKRGPTGTGDVTFRIEGNAMNVTRMHYFNRGVEVRAQARVGNLAIVPDCPLSGTAVGSARPLRDVKLPIFSTLLPDVDAILSAIQNTAATVQIGGTLHKPTTTVIPFNDIGQGMKELLTGDIRSEVQGSAGQ